MKPDKILAVLIVFLLLVVDWLAFHDLLEPHTVRDWLMLAASILVFFYIARSWTNRKTLS